MNAFGELLQDLKPSHMTWSALADHVGMTRSQMSLLVRGTHRPSRSTIDRIARQLEADKAALSIAAGYVPDDLLKIIARHPVAARQALQKVEAEQGSGPAVVTRETRSEDLTWKAALRKPLLARLREEFQQPFSAPWNTARHQVLVLPGYRIYNAKLFYGRFPPDTQHVRFGFWVEKGLDESPTNPEWKMKSTWDWHALLEGLRDGSIGRRELGLEAGLEAFAGSWGPKEVRWRVEEGRLVRTEAGKSKPVSFSDIKKTLLGWPDDRWCDFIVSSTLATDELERDMDGAIDKMMAAYEAVFPTLRRVAAHFRD